MYIFFNIYVIYLKKKEISIAAKLNINTKISKQAINSNHVSHLSVEKKCIYISGPYHILKTQF